MVAALLEVHHDVEQGDLVSSALRVQRLKVLGQNQLVVFPVFKTIASYCMCHKINIQTLSLVLYRSFKLVIKTSLL